MKTLHSLPKQKFTQRSFSQILLETPIITWGTLDRPFVNNVFGAINRTYTVEFTATFNGNLTNLEPYTIAYDL